MTFRKSAAVLAALILLAGTNTLPAEALTLPEESLTSSAAQYDLEPMLPEMETRTVTEGALTFLIYSEIYTNESYAEVSHCEKDVVSVEIPAEVEGVPVTSVSSGVFGSCMALREITIAEEQTNFTTIDGVLFDKNGRTLLAYPHGKGESYEIPAGTKTIGMSAFSTPEGYSPLKKITFPEGLEKIETYAFCRQSGLTELDLPDSCKYVYVNAFLNCTGLESIHFGKNFFSAVGAFTGCTGLKTLTGNPTYFKIVDNVLYEGTRLVLYPPALGAASYSVKDGTTGIGTGAFNSCTALEEVVLPDSLTTIYDAFCDMPNLKTLTIPEGVTSIGSILKNCTSLETLYLPSTLDSTGYMMLSGCGALTDVYFGGTAEEFRAVTNLATNTRIRTGNILVHFGDEGDYTVGELNGLTYKKFADHVQIIRYTYDGETTTPEIPAEIEGLPVTSIGMEAFRGQRMLTSIRIPESVTEIGALAFQSCTGLTELILPEGLQKIGDYAISGCSGITEIEIPSGMTEVGMMVFAQTGLTEVTVPDGTEILWTGAFRDCQNLETVHLPESLTEIGGNAFIGCKALKSIDLPDGITYLGNSAFARSGLTEIDFPEAIQVIDNSCFSGCLKLTSIDIPEGIAELRRGVFEQTGLREVIVPETIQSIGDYAFYRCESLQSITILNPECDIAMYKTAICNDEFELPSQGCVIVSEPICLSDICGWSGSTAEAYATLADAHFIPLDGETTGNPEPIRGDVDEDGDVDLMDVISLNRYLMVGEPLSKQGALNADVDDSGKVTSADSLKILRYIVEILDTLN